MDRSLKNNFLKGKLFSGNHITCKKLTFASGNKINVQ